MHRHAGHAAARVSARHTTHVAHSCHTALEMNKTDEAAVTVRDSGIGIPEEDLPHIFERFYRSDKSCNRLTGGSGIGLTIAKSIVEENKDLFSNWKTN